MKSLDKGNRMEKVLGEGRMRLFDKMVGSRGGGMGKKTNPRCRFCNVYVCGYSYGVCFFLTM
jgi:hypothetical protein